MKIIFYRLIYWPPVNRLIRNLLMIGHKWGLTTIKIPPSGTTTFSLSGENKIVMATNQSSFLTSVIYWKGIFAFEYSEIFIDLIKEMNVFVDIGANIGFYSLLSKKVNKNIEVHAFEPAAGPFAYLKKNVALSSDENPIHIYKIALSDSKGEIDFYEHKNPKYKYLKHNLGGVSSEVRNTDSSMFQKTVVEAKTLDSFAMETLSKKIDLIKIDTEGTENRILFGGQNIIGKERPIIICETLFNKIEDQLEVFMRNHNYLFFNHVKNRLVKVDTIIRKSDNGVRDCFFVPREKENLVTKYL